VNRLKELNVMREKIRKYIPAVAVALVVGTFGSVAYRAYAGECCAPGAACCKPGAECCAGHKHASH